MPNKQPVRRVNLTDPPTLEEHIIAIIVAWTIGKQIRVRIKRIRDGIPKGSEDNWLILNQGAWNFVDYEYKVVEPYPHKETA